MELRAVSDENMPSGLKWGMEKCGGGKSKKAGMGRLQLGQNRTSVLYLFNSTFDGKFQIYPSKGNSKRNPSPYFNNYPHFKILFHSLPPSISLKKL